MLTTNAEATLQRLEGKLRCPDCQRGTLTHDAEESLRCMDCSQAFPIVEGLPLLFPAADLPALARQDEERRRHGLQGPKKDSGGMYHWREYHIEDFLPAPSVGMEALLLGCGDAAERPYLERLGLETTAFDIKRTCGTDFLADAHRLPFHDEAFDLVLSMQVLEHLHSPWTAVQEIARVLRPGGQFIGSVAFLKPYHGGSYYHMTHKGVTHLLCSHGLQVDRIEGAQSLTYSVYGGLIPLGSRRFRRFFYGAWDQLLRGLRAKVWSLITHIDPDSATGRFEVGGLPLSFRAFDRLRTAPAVVFRALKATS